MIEDYADHAEKAWGQFQLGLNGIFLPFRRYGQDVYIPAAKEETMALAHQLHMRLLGEDVPIAVSEAYIRQWI